ncbi:MAG: glycosyl hydrolase, partial [FCB group bacterium]|nr:glycosyl hydrolase [FCB group bacterium]
MATAQAEGSGDVLKSFENPPREYSSAPFWVWNDLLTEDQIRQSLQEFAGQNIHQVIVHPRPGLMTPYLSEDWFNLFAIALDEAKKLDMNLWIYDENSYPSGFGGGFVPDVMPESATIGIDFEKGEKPGAVNEDTVAVFQGGEKGYTNVTDAVKKGEALPDGDYVTVKLAHPKPSPWFAGKNYVDLLRTGVTEKFLEVTLEPYRERFGDEFGKRIPGSFTDEPHLRGVGTFHWTPDLPEEFEKRWGYSFVDNLPSLMYQVGDWKKFRHDYYAVLLDLFVERFAKPYYEYCEKNNLEMTGHFWEHSFPDMQSAPDNMAMYAYQQRPAIDILFNEGYQEDAHAQVGNVRAVLELGSIANQMGKKRTLCEAYGGSGWDARFEDFKRINDWINVLGVNTMNQHLSHITIRGARKGDYPPTFSYHSPWFDAYNVLVQYGKRLDLVTSSGQQVNDVLVLEPTTTIWMYQGKDAREQSENIGNVFQKLTHDMSGAQIEFDLGSEHTIGVNGSVDGDGFVVGKRRYTTVVIPPLTETLNTKTIDLLEDYLNNGGQVLALGDNVLTLQDAKADLRLKDLTHMPGWNIVKQEDAVAELAKRGTAGFIYRRAEGDTGRLLHMRRELADGNTILLTNTHETSGTKGTIVAPAAGVVQWDLETGKTKPYAFTKTADGVEVSFDLAPAGSLLLFFTKDAVEPAVVPAVNRSVVAASGPMSIRRDGPNVLTLDFMDVTAGGETKENLLYAQAMDFTFVKNGMQQNPWDHAIQFKDEFITKTFPADSGFEATYHFAVADAVPANLEIVIERPDLYTITCNGKPVTAKPGEWWLDRAFGRIALNEVAQVGENTVTIKAVPFTIFSELQRAYLLGDFSVKPAAKGFTINADQPLELGAWNAQGMPLYGHGVTYSQSFKIDKVEGRFVVAMPKWFGSVAKVRVNGKEAGYIYRQPFDLDVTSFVTAGDNTVEITV